MKKLFVFSYDDGTVHDIKMISILNQYGIKATFNLNSGLKDYVWYTEGKAIKRLDLEAHKSLYDGHEVAVHTVTHPYLTELDDEMLYKEVVDDQKALSNIFGYNVIGMGVPFDQCTNEIVEKIRSYGVIEHLRFPTWDGSFELPKDPMYIPITIEHTHKEVDKLIDQYIELKPDDLKLFVLVGHSYDFYVENNWDWLEKNLEKLKRAEDIHIVTMKEAVEIIFNKK